MSEANSYNDACSDSLSIVKKSEGRKWISPKKPSGRFYNARTILSIILLAVFFGLPFIKINGHPFMLLNILERKFILFGLIFTPQDFFLFGLTVITIMVSLVLITAVFGRIFCGWFCPQTIFLEMVFRKIEYIIEGDYLKQIALNNSKWNSKKIFKKGIKYLIFFIISFLIANMFLSYIIGVDSLFKIITEPVANHMTGFMSIIIFTLIFYAVFAWFREQACTLVCPYGRLQSVLLDKNSIVIAYDFIRGEPRGKLSKGKENNSGDCIDCKLCVKVCPTGIDIRNGTQLECVNCTACIDACDEVMVKIGKPKGLIRFASAESIINKTKKLFTLRVAGYAAIFLVLVSVTSYLFAERKDIDVNIFRTPGMLYQNLPDNKVSNVYNMKISNKTFDDIPVDLRLLNDAGEIKITGREIVIKPAEIYEGSFLVIIPKDKIHSSNTPLRIGIYSSGNLIDEVKSSFLGPQN